MIEALLLATTRIATVRDGHVRCDGILFARNGRLFLVARNEASQSGREGLPWTLPGVHTSRMDVTNRDIQEDSRLNLNTAWYADILLALTV
jgi:hypothetical protein